MRAGFIEEPGKAYFKEVPEPQIEKSTDVKIKVVVTGICGSEVHAYHGKHAWRVPPLVSGHEFAGIVVEVGSDVTSVKVGDRVTAEPQYGCGDCPQCRIGKYNICKNKKILGATYWSGSFGEYVVVPEKTVVHLSDDVSFEEGALIEPIAVGMHAVRERDVSIGQNILIIGAGTIGLGVYLSAKICNPSKIIVADVVDYNLEMARELGCEYTINSMKENLEAEVKKLTNGEGVDITFLAFGNAPVVESASKCTKEGGVISEIAVIPNGTGCPYNMIQVKQQSLMGSNMYVRKDYEVVVENMAKGRIDSKKMVSKIYPIEEFTAAMEMADKRTEPVVKVMLKF